MVQVDSSKKSGFIEGAKAALPISVGVVPFGVAYGVLALLAGLPVGPAVGMSSILFAGSAQVVSLPLLSSGVPPSLILLSVLLVNLRHILYSASLCRYFTRLSLPWKALLSYLLTDEAYAVTITHFGKEPLNNPPKPNDRQFYLLGAGITFWAAWQTSTLVGVFFSTIVPSNLALDFAITLTFIGLLVPSVKDKPSVATAITSGVVALAAVNLPFKLNIIVAVAISVTIGLLVGRIEHQRRRRS